MVDFTDEGDEQSTSQQKIFEFLDRQNICQSIIRHDNAWQIPKTPISLGDFNWSPDLLDATKRVCFIHLSGDELSTVWSKRLIAASNRGYRVTFASPKDLLYSNPLLSSLNEIGCGLLPLDYDAEASAWVAGEYFPNAASYITGNDILLSSEDSRIILSNLYSKVLKAQKATEKGRTFEQLLGFIFSQVTFFRVISSNYKNSTEEIDIVLENHSQQFNHSPIVLVSAKNTSTPVGAPALTSLYSKMKNRFGMCQIGFLCSFKKIAGTVAKHRLRFSRTNDGVVALIDEKVLQQLQKTPDALDEHMRSLIIKAALD